MFGGNGVHPVQQRIPQMKMMKVHIPFTFKLHETSNSSYSGKCLHIFTRIQIKYRCIQMYVSFVCAQETYAFYQPKPLQRSNEPLYFFLNFVSNLNLMKIHSITNCSCANVIVTCYTLYNILLYYMINRQVAYNNLCLSCVGQVR